MRLSLPLVMHERPPPAMPPIQVGLLTVEPPPTDRPAAQHPDLNLALRGYVSADAERSLVDYNGDADAGAPRLWGLLNLPGEPTIGFVYRVYDWDWGAGHRGEPLSTPPVTLLGLAAERWQPVYVPPSGYTIGQGEDARWYNVLVLYADDERLTLKYTREDNVASGYTLHVEGVVVHPDLLAAYEQANAAGRARLPALASGELLGLAAGGEVGVAIRDAGTFMDPRSRKDWW